MVEAYRLYGEDTCKPSGKVSCNGGKSYLTYKCSPPVSSHTKATLTINSFEEGGDMAADPRNVTVNTIPIMTFWLKLLMNAVRLVGGAPCRNNIVDASKAVWKALGVPESDWGEMDVYWSN
ncbi:hypothetical protein V6N12_001710 [Hibiscus sabdariffa]|uniref:Ripening-related protein n=1 Tax=Hibiscus sabdariffa TaxID=183260 RepID=A0ABR2BR56_9ROSI